VARCVTRADAVPLRRIQDRETAKTCAALPHHPWPHALKIIRLMGEPSGWHPVESGVARAGCCKTQSGEMLLDVRGSSLSRNRSRYRSSGYLRFGLGLPLVLS
jgi:hypothetical protein